MCPLTALKHVSRQQKLTSYSQHQGTQVDSALLTLVNGHKIALTRCAYTFETRQDLGMPCYWYSVLNLEGERTLTDSKHDRHIVLVIIIMGNNDWIDMGQL